MAIVSEIARRILTGKKQNQFVSFISAVSLFGVAVGVAALLVVMGVMEGFEDTLQKIITGTRSHIFVYSNRTMIRSSEGFVSRLQQEFPAIEAGSPYFLSQIMLAKEGRVAGSAIEGIDIESMKAVTNIEDFLVAGELFGTGEDDQSGILLGKVVAEKLRAKVGDEISLIAPYFDKKNMQPRAIRIKVRGILSMGMYEYDSKYSAVSMKQAVDFFQVPPLSATAVRLKVKDVDTSNEYARKIQTYLGYPYVARDWSEMNQNLLYAIKLQKVVIFIVLTAIIIVAAFNIMSTLVMMLHEKRREMSILKTMGMRAKQSAAVFVGVGLIIGASGCVAGVALGFLIGTFLSTTRFISLPPDVYAISYLPVHFHASTLAVIILAAMLVAFLATIYPSVRVARESPLEGLRYE